MKVIQFVVAVTAAVAAGAVFAQSGASVSGASVVRAKGCNNCHAKIGPSFKDIAAKKGDQAAQVAKLKDGKGHPKIKATDEEIKAAVEYVHAQK